MDVSKNIRTTLPSKKLDHKLLGKFNFTQVVSSYANSLGLPLSMKVHPVIHVSLLEPAAEDWITGQVAIPSPPVVLEGHEKWEVEEVLDSRLFRRQPQYLSKWLEYDMHTWELPSCLENALEVVERIHGKYPTKPGSS